MNTSKINSRCEDGFIMSSLHFEISISIDIHGAKINAKNLLISRRTKYLTVITIMIKSSDWTSSIYYVSSTSYDQSFQDGDELSPTPVD
jgi:hypothetical protein